MTFIKYQFDCAESDTEALLGLLSSLDFDSFEEKPGRLEGYIDISLVNDQLASSLDVIQKIIPFKVESSEMENTNWNALWESNFDPVRIEDFCGIRASFHPHFDPPVKYEILIDPKMAFGTGHHETTSLVVSTMKDLDLQGKSVFDYGCGTGVLAILAKMCGAGFTDAVDIEQPAYENTLENVENNGALDVQVYHGTLETVPARQYDLILANINRNVILESLADLRTRLAPGGRMIISGFIQADLTLMQDAVKDHGFQIIGQREKNHWISMELTGFV